MALSEQEEFELLSLERQKYAGGGGAAPKTPEKPEYMNTHNVIMGALSNAADMGATMLRPVDAILNATGITDKTNVERRKQLGEFFQQNANPESTAFKGGGLIADIAGTAGIGGILAKGAKVGGAGPKVINALESGGFRLGNYPNTAGNTALRAAAGGAVGGASAGLTNPDDAATGATIGALLPGGVKVAGALGSGMRSLGEHVLGNMTGTSAETMREAFKAGKTGAKDFVENMRGKVPFDDVVDRVKEGLRTMRKERGDAYRSGMVDIKNDATQLDMNPILNAMRSVESSGMYKGKAINEKSAETIQEIAAKVDDWAKSNPAEFHTPEGLDALKQAIGDIRDSTLHGTPARRAADIVYNSVKSEIKKQAPTYERVMKDYESASTTIKEIEKALSAGEKSSKDTAMRKLQSLMRNNANTNYGNRMDLARELEQKGGVEIFPSIAGQSLNSWTPRGLQRLVTGSGAPALALTGNPMTAAVLAAASSPRLMGEAAYAAGRAAGGAKSAASGAANKVVSPEMQRRLSELYSQAAPATAVQSYLAAR